MTLILRSQFLILLGFLLLLVSGSHKIFAAEGSVDYKRKGQAATLPFTGPDGLDATVTLRCNGTASGGTGGWSLETVQGYCGTSTPILPEHVELTATPIDTSDGTNPKHYRTTVDSGITGETGDDMFRIDPGAEGFFEYGKMAEDARERAIYIERDGGKPLGLMMPSGLAANGYQDYLTFVENAPDFVRIEEACTPLTLNVCDGVVPASPVCGTAQGQGYENIAGILPDFQCDAGMASTVNDNGAGQFTWNCTGGSETVNCFANKKTNAVCGPAQGRTYSSPPPAHDRCSVGVPTAILVNSGSYNWTCKSPDAGADTPCSAGNTQGPASNCLQNMHIPPNGFWSFYNRGWQNWYRLGIQKNDYFQSNPECTLFEYTFTFNVIDPSKIGTFGMGYQGWDDIMEISINGQRIWHSRGDGSSWAEVEVSQAFGKRPGSLPHHWYKGLGPWPVNDMDQCELYRSWEWNSVIDFKQYLRPGQNTITLRAWVQGGGEAWFSGRLEGNCLN